MDRTHTSQQQPYALPEAIAERSFLANRGKLIIAAGVFLLALGYLAFNAFQGATAYYLTVGELVAKGSSVYDRNVRVNGKLVPSSFQREQDGTSLRFSLTDGQSTIMATHEGLVPDLFFNEHSEILLEGTYGYSGVFDAQSIIVKCPSKYQSIDDTT
ncbi:MAG: cytochrome c maturation protein CcmE [Chloroflexi bacterium]|nr:cytochrome c maturation protein CcmE [Chloroflexota bacterium]